ncbi:MULTISPECIES: Wadjet anti-phage system protein JetD domain-containing protein [Pseudomonas]|jgi:hypothetical protein|uniref:Wadjet protein JetD C-terminal domain-containing protein n=1 Tax=Pseudomonas putida (strain ATCC 47054 / DSM 6125 / CFBP 8728 / NCIMB 11950 / KT2440) TaxID=160488 RepID=Q88GM6_PSEPK|nr:MULTISPECIES: Wadjet anti-phage system protein JetD domain-containing protein [Pseudomonas]AAN69292.1 conserved protein of unknown function [Pseudomonas putida KT2440]KMU97140.1 hypothetical protein AC138_04780 [Pseudomonas putida]KMY30943.1 hypothetical protein AA993_18865 [Pseudomonas putida]MDD2079543.1 DUF2220 family protein [Pseudomonas putida]PXZ50296.1 hypothetical protein DM483_11555 [Pseudomonas sp. SMT-1]
MKSPQELRNKLFRYWRQPGLRLRQLLDQAAWPLVLSIGKPTAQVFSSQVAMVQKHVEAWREVSVGKVEWKRIGYRSGADLVSIPTQWCLRSPTEWITAMSNEEISAQYMSLEHLVEHLPAVYRRLIITRPSLWKNKRSEEVIQVAGLAQRLSPGCAQGLPLRLLSGYGVDTKFFERNELLLSKMLDVRYEGEASRQGLCDFLDAYDDTSHWVLLAPLEAGLLPFKRQLVTTSELGRASLPGTRLLIVENQKCLHLLRELPGTIAILGCGSDLAWLGSAQLHGKSIAYWGDVDTWGMRMLARARSRFNAVIPLLMTATVFDAHSDFTVPEPIRAQDTPPADLTPSETALFKRLVQCSRGRLEQEFISREVVWAALEEWIQRRRG